MKYALVILPTRFQWLTGLKVGQQGWQGYSLGQQGTVLVVNGTKGPRHAPNTPTQKGIIPTRQEKKGHILMQLGQDGSIGNGKSKQDGRCLPKGRGCIRTTGVLQQGNTRGATQT